METTLFLVFGGVSVAAALSLVLMRRVFYSALSLIVCLTSVSALYMLLEAPFIAAVQIIVYAGAIMVLFLFVIMLLDPFSTAALKDKKKYLGVVAVLLGAAGLLMLLPLLAAYRPGTGTSIRPGESVGSVASIGATLFNQYTLPFEVTSILILVAIIGTVVLGRRQS
jgi:NADH-quinone oxidoreductase subunit J